MLPHLACGGTVPGGGAEGGHPTEARPALVSAAPPALPQLICSYVLRPVAFLMGVAWEDCPVVAELLGIKLFLNEFVAYQELSQYKQRRLAGVEEWVGDKKQWISVSFPVPSLWQGCHAPAPEGPWQPAWPSHSTSYCPWPHDSFRLHCHLPADLLGGCVGRKEPCWRSLSTGPRWDR